MFESEDILARFQDKEGLNVTGSIWVLFTTSQPNMSSVVCVVASCGEYNTMHYG